MATTRLDGSQKSDCTLAIDLGTSGPKVALVSVQGEVVACEIEKTPVMLLPGGGAEQAPDDWWKAICTARDSPWAMPSSGWMPAAPPMSDGSRLDRYDWKASASTSCGPGFV
jgi:hypothetical protein